MGRAPAAAPSPGVTPFGPHEASRQSNLRDRLAITIVLAPTALLAVQAGGAIFLLAVFIVFGMAAWEYVRLFRAGQQRPSRPLVVAGVLLLIAAEQVPALNPHGVLTALLVLGALGWHVVDYERGAPSAGTDFTITLGGIFYLGGLGRYFVLLRALPDGLWWLAAVLTSVWLADSGAYFFGRRFGRHRMAPRLSPRKTWEGYMGSVLVGAAAGGLLSMAWGLGAGPGSLLNGQTGLMLGALVGALGPVGDLGISMLKRQSGVKDTGNIMAGHGGALDRIDSWLVAVTVGYYFVLALPFILRSLGQQA